MPMPDKAVYWYILNVRTGTEEKVEEILTTYLDSAIFSTFIPRKTCVYRRQGQKSEFQKICFPGYVFIESDKTALDFLERVFPIVYRFKDAYRFLCYGEDRSDIAMRENERAALNKVLGEDHCIDISRGFKEGDSVKVISGALIDSESEILRINKNNKNAVIVLNMFGSAVEVSVGLDIVEKT